jgi:hypothetical protein
MAQTVTIPRRFMGGKKRIFVRLARDVNLFLRGVTISGQDHHDSSQRSPAARAHIMPAQIYGSRGDISVGWNLLQVKRICTDTRLQTR